MAQPKLSNDSIKPLLAIGPFDGLDATTDPYYLDQTFVRDSINFVPNYAYKGLALIRGRVIGAYPLPNVPTSLAIFYPKNALASLVAVTQNGAFQYQVIQPPSAPWAPIMVPGHLGHHPTGNPGAFVRYTNWLFFTNNDPNALCYKFDKNYNATFWGIAQPPGKPNTTVTSPSDGMIYGDNYYYRYTYSAGDPTDTDTTKWQESTPSAPAGPFSIGTMLSPPQSNSATIAQVGAPTLVPDTSGGTIPAGSYFIGTTWVTAAGEEGISQSAQITITGAPPNEICVTPAGSSPPGATGFNIYTGTSSSAMTQQGGTRSLAGVPNPCGTGGSLEENYATTGSPAPAFTGLLNPPAAPVIHAISSGSLPARTEYYELTYVNGQGETTASPEVSINLAANQVTVVTSPSANANATHYNVYASTTSAEEILQNSSPIAIGTDWTEPNAGLTLGQSASLVLQCSDDPQVTQINVYRIGGQSLGNWYFVGEVPNTGSTQTFVDNTPDSAVTGQTLVLHRDPPAPFGAVFEHVERIFGFGYHDYTGFNGHVFAGRPCDLWYSNYNEPWGFDNTNQVIPVGAQDKGDVAVQGASMSSIGILWKSKTTWALYGQSPSDFFVQKLFDVGCASRGSAIVALGVAFWLSQQGFYMYDGATLTYLSRPIKKILDAFTESDFASSTACFDDRMYWCAFPGQGIALGYDTVSQNWYKASLSTTLFAFDTEAQSRPTAPDWVFGANQTANRIDQWFAATTDLEEPISASLTTRLGTTGPQIGTMRVRFIELVSSANIGPEDQVTVTVTANPASTARSFSKEFTTSPLNLRQRASVPMGIQGDELQLSMAVTSSDGLVIEGCGAHGWIRRLYNTVN